MLKNPTKYLSKISMALFFVGVCLRLVIITNNLSTFYVYLFYIVFFGAIISIAFDSLQIKQYPKPFVYDNTFHINIFAFLLSLGFFIDFVYECVLAGLSIKNQSYIEITYFIPICLCAVFSLLSFFYFVIVGLSYSNTSYDFKEFQLLHLVPLLWALSHILMVLKQVISISYDLDIVIKYIMLIFALCFFYRFASEVDNKNLTKPVTIFVARAYSYSSMMFFLDRLMLVLLQSSKITDPDNVFAVTALFLSGFAFFFEKSIISRIVQVKE